MTDSPNLQSDSRRTEVESRIATALRSLLNEGIPWADVTVDAITKEACIKRTLFYVYFSDRNAVLVRLGDDLIQATTSGINDRWLLNADGPESLRSEIEAFWATQTGFAPVLKALMEGATVDPSLREYWKQLSRAFVQPTKRRIEDAKAAGHRTGTADPKMLALCLVLMTEKVVLEALLDVTHDRDSLADAAFEIWNLALYGVQ